MKSGDIAHASFKNDFVTSTAHRWLFRTFGDGSEITTATKSNGIDQRTGLGSRHRQFRLRFMAMLLYKLTIWCTSTAMCGQ